MKKQFVQSEFEILTVSAEDCIATSISTSDKDPNVPDSTQLDPSIKE